MKRLGVAEIIDSVLTHQPEVEVSYGKLALVVIINRLSFDPQPLYAMRDWAERHGIDRLLGIEAAWLDNDQLGALMEALTKHAVDIWLKGARRQTFRDCFGMAASRHNLGIF